MSVYIRNMSVYIEMGYIIVSPYKCELIKIRRHKIFKRLNEFVHIFLLMSVCHLLGHIQQ